MKDITTIASGTTRRNRERLDMGHLLLVLRSAWPVRFGDADGSVTLANFEAAYHQRLLAAEAA
jgi:hypothetical protein